MWRVRETSRYLARAVGGRVSVGQVQVLVARRGNGSRCERKLELQGRRCRAPRWYSWRKAVLGRVLPLFSRNPVCGDPTKCVAVRSSAGSTEPAPLCRPRHSWFVSGRASAAVGATLCRRSLNSTPDACTCRRGWCATCRRARRGRSRSAFRRSGQLTASRSASSHSRLAQQGRWHGSAVISAYRFKAAA